MKREEKNRNSSKYPEENSKKVGKKERDEKKIKIKIKLKRMEERSFFFLPFLLLF